MFVIAIYTASGHNLHFSIHRKDAKKRKEDNALVAANSIEYFRCILCAFAVNKNSVLNMETVNLL